MRFFIFLLLCTFALNAQNTYTNDICKVELGVKHNKDANETHSNVIPYKDNGFYLTKYKGLLMRDISIEFYNEDLELQKTIETEFGGKNIRGSLMKYNDKMYCYSVHLDRKKNVYSFLKQELDPNTFKPLEDFIEIDRVGFNKRDLITFGIPIHFASSNNGKNFITYKGIANKKLLKPTVLVKGFDDELNFIWEKTFDLPYNIDLYENEIVNVDDNGLFYFLGKVYNKKAKDRVKGEINFTYDLFIYDPKTDKSKKCELSLGEYFVNAVNFKFNEANNVICSGFYSKKGNYSVDGCFFMEINAETLEIVTRNVEEFSVDFMKEDVSNIEANSIDRKEARGKDTEMPRFEMIKSYYNDDGSVVLVAEQRKIFEITRHNPNRKPGLSISVNTAMKEYLYI